MSTRPLHVYRLGRVEYDDGLRLQELFGKARLAGLTPDVLLLLEHPPVLTLGRAAKGGNIVAPKSQLDELGVDVFETNRGGDVTYHGPGQIVGYPIIKLEPGRQDVRRYVRDVEETLLRTLDDYGLPSTRISKWPGVWRGAEGSPDARKIAAIGVHLSRWQTSHGFALNVNTQLSHFELIVPCGIKEAGVTSMQKELGREVPVAEVEDRLAHHFAQIFDATPEERTPELKTISVAITRGDDLLLLKRTEARGGFWQLVTGKVEQGESVAEAAARETEEETGAALDLRPLNYRHTFAFADALPPRVFEETAFAAKWRSGEPRLDPTEHTEYRFVKLDEALTLLPFAGLKRAARLALTR